MRAYLPLSVNFLGDDRVVDLSPLARLEYVSCLLISKRQESDGRVTLAQVRREQPDLGGHEALLDELVEAGLLNRDGARGFWIPAWLRWNKTSVELDEMRDTKAAAGRLGGKRSGEVRAPGQPKQHPKHAASDVASEDRSTLLQDVEAGVEANTTQHTTPERNTHTSPPPASKPFEADFVALWNVWRKKEDKARSLRAYQSRRRDGTDHEVLVHAATRYTAATRDRDPKLTKSLAAFLHGTDGPWTEYLEIDASEVTTKACASCLVLGAHAPDCEKANG